MNKFLFTFIAFSLLSFVIARDVAPSVSLRYDNLSTGIQPSQAIGLKLNIDDNKYTGFDTDGFDHRIFVGWSFGKIGLGVDNLNTPEYTVGATYPVLENLYVDLDYVINEAEDHLRLSLTVEF